MSIPGISCGWNVRPRTMLPVLLPGTLWIAYPSSVKSDCGTENMLVAAIQSAAVQSPTAHVYGTSPGNQRIESWWRNSHDPFATIPPPDDFGWNTKSRWPH